MYVDVSNLEYPVLQIVVVGGARIVMFASVCGLMLFVFSNGLFVLTSALLSFPFCNR